MAALGTNRCAAINGVAATMVKAAASALATYMRAMTRLVPALIASLPMGSCAAWSKPCRQRDKLSAASVLIVTRPRLQLSVPRGNRRAGPIKLVGDAEGGNLGADPRIRADLVQRAGEERRREMLKLREA